MMQNDMAAGTPAADQYDQDGDGQQGGYDIVIHVAESGEITVDGSPVGGIEDAVAVVKDIHGTGGPPDGEDQEMDDLMSGYGKGGVAAKRGMPVNQVLRED